MLNFNLYSEQINCPERTSFPGNPDFDLETGRDSRQMNSNKKKGKNLHDIKEENQSLVLKLICTGQCTSRAEISRRTGLTKMTITNIIQALLNENLILEGPLLEKTTVGRKPVLLFPSENAKRSIGVYISRDVITLSLLSLNAKIIKKYDRLLSPDENAETLTGKIFDGLDMILEGEDKTKILGIGVACIGPLDLVNGVILSPPEFYGIENLPIRQLISDKTGLPVFVNNDMSTAALAEHLYGFGTGCDHFIYFGITHGIGSGIVANGKLFSGAEGYGGEIGHTSIRYDGVPCFCGNKGCLEAYASMPVFMNETREQASKVRDSLLFNKPELEFEDVVLAAQKGDPLAVERMEYLVTITGTALVNSIHLMNSSKILIGHESARGGEWFAQKLETYINAKSIFRRKSHVGVQVSKFGEHSPVIGSGVLVFDQFFQGSLS